MLNGQIDHCRGRYIFGWAYPGPGREHCRINVADASGQVVASAIAAEPRDDLTVIGQGRVDFSFRIGVPRSDVAGPVRVLADGAELPGSPLFLGPDIYDGQFSIDGGNVAGWVSSREAVSAADPVLLYDQDDSLVATVSTTLDDDTSDKLFRPARFTAPLPAQCFGRKELHLTAKIGRSAFAHALGSGRLEGYLDFVTDNACAGWLFAVDSPERSFELAVYRDGVKVGSGRTQFERADVSLQFPGVGRCGFDLSLLPPEALGRGLSHVSIRIVGSDRELLGGPFLVGSRVQAAQDALDAAAVIERSEALHGVGASLLRTAFSDWLSNTRTGPAEVRLKARPLPLPSVSTRRIAIVIPVHSDVVATRVCLDSVLRVRREGSDAIVIVNDNPGDQVMAELVDAQSRHPDVFILRNAQNEGFVGAVNRGMDFARAGDVLLLNADTELFAGAIDEMHRVLHDSPNIGTVTALSNNATLFSYPHPTIVEQDLADISWPDLAAVALQENAGKAVQIPTAHGFCMLIRRAVVDEIGLFDPSFGRGYGEENDYSLCAADRGWCHVAAGGALVRHVEAVSFGAEKQALVAANLRLVQQRFPEYAALVERFAMQDELRKLRWPLDFHRLRNVAATGVPLELVIENGLDGGSRLAASDIEAVVRAPDVRALRLSVTTHGAIHLRLDGMQLLAVFQPQDAAELFRMLGSLPLQRVVVHHLIGFNQDFVHRLRGFVADRQAIFHVHDYYYACPRVTMIDASGEFCGGAATDQCERCVAMAGRHLSCRMGAGSVADHRALFQDVLAQATHVITPSEDTAERLRGMIPGIQPVAVPHPQTATTFPIGVRRGTTTDICLLGGIGPHKGSQTLLSLARHARLHRPELRFHVIGHTNLDVELSSIGNVSISAKYDRDDLPRLVEATQSRVALFLHGWPETFSYTLTEAVGLGLIPLVPDIGAPAERVRNSGFGVVFPFPIDIGQVMKLLVGVAGGIIGFSIDGALPLGFDTSESQERLRALYHGAGKLPDQTPARKPGRRRPPGPVMVSG